MRILMVVRQFFPWVGGTERQAQKLATKLAEMGINVTIVTGWWFWGTPRTETIDKVLVFRNFACWGMFGVKGLRKLGGYLYILSLFWYFWKHRHKYDLIHIHLLSYAAFPAVLAGQWLGKKTIIKIANSDEDSDIRRMQQNDMIPGQRQMLPVVLRADKFVAINKKIIQELINANVSPERIEFIPNGVEVKEFVPKSNYELGDSVTLIFVGRLHPQKGLHVLFRAFHQLVRRRTDIPWRLWLLGDGPLRAELETLSKQLDINQEVKFWGIVDDVSHYLTQADIFVMPSRAEGMSNALLEAMAHGLPCAVTQISGNLDLVQHGQNALLFAYGDETALVEAIIQLADNQTLRQSLGVSAHLAAKIGYSMDSVAAKYITLYKVLLN